MHFSTIFLSLVSLAMAEPVKVNLQLEPVDGSSALDGKCLAAFHEGAAFNYFFALDNADPLMGPDSFYRDTSDNSIYQKIVTGDGVVKFDLTTFDSVLGDAAGEFADQFKVVDGYLALNGSITPGWYGEYNVPEPYGYGKTYPAIVLRPNGAPAGSEQVKIRVVDYAA